MKTASILVADDHTMVRRGMVAVVNAQPGWAVVAEAVNGREAVELARQHRPDVAVLDIAMPEMNGLDATRRIVAAQPSIQVVILTMNDSEQALREAIACGARGFLLKSDLETALVASIEAVLRQGVFLTPRHADEVFAAYALVGRAADEPAATLTAREREVVQCLAEGLSSKQVAARLRIARKTADAHRGNIMRKLKLASVGALVRYALRENIVAL